MCLTLRLLKSYDLGYHQKSVVIVLANKLDSTLETQMKDHPSYVFITNIRQLLWKLSHQISVKKKKKN